MNRDMTQLTLTDRILAKTLLPLVPRFVTPNSITVFRFATIPFVCWFLLEGDYIVGLSLFMLSAFSDAVDGSLARTRNQITEWGKTFDPLADKLLIGSASLIMVSEYLNPYLAATIVSIEFSIIASAYYRKRVYGIPIEAETSGKAKMVLQSFGVGSIIFGVIFEIGAFFTIAYYLLYLAIVFAIISLVVYKSI